MKKIIDINGKKKNVLYAKKILNAAYDSINNVTIDEEFVEAMVMGKNSNWIVWYPLADFEEKNPNFVLE